MGRQKRRMRTGGLILLGLCVAGVVSLEACLRLVPFDATLYRRGEVSTIVFDRAGKPLRAYLANDDRWRIPVRLDEISPWLVKATLAIEDKRFHSHRGIDLVALGRAVLQNLRAGRIVSGASTLTMQVAGFQQGRERTLGRKLLQAFRALQMERHLSKDQILELYLTHAPYGGNICGAEAAARRYFNKSARDLTLAEAALLAGIPQAPTRLRPDRHPDAALVRRQRVLEALVRTGWLAAKEKARVAAQKPRLGTFDAEASAPHFCDLVQSRHGQEVRITTSLDGKVQATAEQLLKGQVRKLRLEGVTNGAVVVLHNRTGEVRALVGSADYASLADEGQLNGALVARSPGSTLKPLIYAFAYQAGNLLPGSVLYDVPQQYPEYQPENFDRLYRGLVTADEALAWSLNVPAIQVLNETGLSRSCQFLRSCGLHSLRYAPDSYGLSLAIGTCSVSLLELTNAYAMLARGGEYRPFRLTRAEERRDSVEGGQSQQLLSPAACFFVSRALADANLRPPETVDSGLAGLEGVAWKTGTSSGFRDAWTVAYDANYTVGVWMGNFNGRASRSLVGAQAAAPVALGMLMRLREPGNRLTWPLPPKGGVRNLTVCSETGYPADDDCPTTRSGEAVDPAGEGLHRHQLPRPMLCSVHRAGRVAVERGHELCTRCTGKGDWEERVFAYWPTPVAAWLSGASCRANLPLPHNPECPTVARGAGIRITSPMEGDAFVLMSERDAETQKLALEAAAPSGSRKLYWFLDGELVTAGERAQVAYVTPTPGPHVLRCMDEAGHADLVRFTVVAD